MAFRCWLRAASTQKLLTRRVESQEPFEHAGEQVQAAPGELGLVELDLHPPAPGERDAVLADDRANGAAHCARP